MQQIHFDIEQSEKAIRAMYAALAPSDEPLNRVTRQMVELTVAFERFRMEQGNKGEDADIVIPALLCWMAGRITDLSNHNNPQMIFALQARSLDIVAAHIDEINDMRERGEPATGTAYLNPTTGGNA